MQNGHHTPQQLLHLKGFRTRHILLACGDGCHMHWRRRKIRLCGLDMDCEPHTSLVARVLLRPTECLVSRRRVQTQDAELPNSRIALWLCHLVSLCSGQRRRMAHVDLEGHIRPSGRTHPVAVRDCFVSGFRRKGRNGASWLSAVGEM